MKVAVFGEILLRLSPPGKERLFQSPILQATFGGSEANVGVSLSTWGHNVRMITVLPLNAIGESALGELARWELDTAFVRRAGNRLGLYYAETGSGPRPSRVTYDRDGSGLSEAKPGDFDWDKALAGRDWFHVSGITPGLSAHAADLTREAVGAARSQGLAVSVDLNYRSKLWRYGQSAPDVMKEIVSRADLLCANEEDCQKALGISVRIEAKAGPLDPALYEDLTLRVAAMFPGLSRVAVTLRENRGADENVWSAVMRTRTGFLTGPKYVLSPIVDRIGAGDAFAAGLIHGLSAQAVDQEALDFAVGASALKHTIPGDFNRVSEQEVKDLLSGDRSGRIRR
ncbi:MAG: sugar kinase [Candidatus Aminicenantes bacterium]|nr:sugar kinase [Candidatus Aminicenantes bacterium]